jgi:YidC/Oxa1 family membrane protein insertase
VGVAVILVSFAIRLALLPLTLRLARRAREHQRRLAELKPDLERLQKRYANDPAGMMRETSRLFRKHGVKQVDPAGLLGGLAQAPVFAALYSTLRRGLGSGARFLWIGDTSLPNLLLNVGVAGLTAGAVVACQTPETTRTMQWTVGVLIAGTTVWFLGSMSALFALSTGAGSVVAMLQGFLLRREERRKV